VVTCETFLLDKPSDFYYRRLFVTLGSASAAAEMSDDIVIRRATVDDYESILKIADDDRWNGYDYLPTLYHVFLQTKRHVFYVAQLNDRLVGIYVYQQTYFALGKVCFIHFFCVEKSSSLAVW